MRKLLHRLKIAAIAAAMTTFAVASAHAFEASGYMTRDENAASYFNITNLETGHSYHFYGTGVSCKDNGRRYNSVARMMSYGSFRAKVVRCPYDPSLVILYINNYHYYTTVSKAPAFDDFGDF